MPEYQKLSHYKIMWLYVFYDLPTKTKKQRKALTDFRKGLLQDGFIMTQYSVYIRHCGSNESAQVHINRIRQMVPEDGQISVIKITDRQFGDTITFTGRKRTRNPLPPQQLELF